MILLRSTTTDERSATSSRRLLHGENEKRIAVRSWVGFSNVSDVEFVGHCRIRRVLRKK